MKWFKHQTNSHKNATLRGIFRKYGLEGEARFWRLIELMTEKFENDNVQFDFDLETIRESLRFRSTTDCRPFLDLLSTLTQMKVEYSGNDCRIIYHKVLEIKDNHTRNLQVTNKQLASNLALEREENKKEKKSRSKRKSTDNLKINDANKQEKITHEYKCEAIVKLWNEQARLNGFVPAKLPIQKDRLELFVEPLKEFPDLLDWQKITTQVGCDPFNTGQNDREWRADLNWLLRKTKYNYRKLWEEYELQNS